MKTENFIKKASNKAINNLLVICEEKYKMNKQEAEEYVSFALNSVARAQSGESSGWSDESARLYYDYAVKEILKAKTKNLFFNKRLGFLVDICVRTNMDFLSELTLVKGKSDISFSVYNAWKHITFENGDHLFSSCDSGKKYDLLDIYNNFNEFLSIVLLSAPHVEHQPSDKAKKQAQKRQSKEMGL